MQGHELAVTEKGQVGRVAQAENDGQVNAMWLHGRPQATQRAYAYEVQGVLAASGKSLQHNTFGDLQGYFSTSAPLAPASQARSINSTKSLFSFAQWIGYLQFNPAAAILASKKKTPWVKGFRLRPKLSG